MFSCILNKIKLWQQIVQMKLDLEQLLNQDVDLVSASGISRYLKPDIDREKVLIYARQIWGPVHV